MKHHETNRVIRTAFIICAIAVVAVTWTVNEKFIADGRVNFFVNLMIGIAAAVAFGRYVENRVNASVDQISLKINRVTVGDLTQRFKEDPEDALPSGFSSDLGAMMDSLRESIGSLWKTSSALIRQLQQFMSATTEALGEFRAETGTLSEIGGSIGTIKGGTQDMSKTLAEVRLRAMADLVALQQVRRIAGSSLDTVSESQAAIARVTDSVQGIFRAAGAMDGLFLELDTAVRSTAFIGKALSELSTESGLVKLNTSIDAAQTQAPAENYRRLIEETQILMTRLTEISKQGAVSSSTLQEKVGDLRERMRLEQEALRKGLEQAEQAGRLFSRMAQECRDAGRAYETACGNTQELSTALSGADAMTASFTASVKESIDRFDRLHSNTQITLLKFGQLEEKIGAIQENLKKLEEFKNRFEIG